MWLAGVGEESGCKADTDAQKGTLRWWKREDGH